MKLKHQIFTALVISGLLPLIFAFTYAIWHSSQTTSQLSLQAAEERLSLVAEQLSAYFENRLIEVDMIARNPLLQNMDFIEMRPFLMQNLKLKNQYYEKFIIGHTNGHFNNTAGGNPHLKMLRTFNDSSPEARPKSIMKRDYWQATIGNNTLDQHTLYISNPMISYTTEVKQIVVSASIHNQRGETVGLLGGALPWKSIQQKIEELQDYLEQGFSGEAKLALISKDGTYWYHWDTDKVIHLARDKSGKFLVDENGEKKAIQTNVKNIYSAEGKNIDVSILTGKTPRLTVNEDNATMHHIFKPVNSAGYTLQLALPESVLRAPTESLVKALFAVFFAASVIAFSLTILISKKLTSPLHSFTSIVKENQHGNLSKVTSNSRTKEFSELVDAYNNMVDTITQQENELYENQERFSLAMRGANDGLWDWNILTNEVYYSPRWKEMLGYSSNELSNDFSTWEQITHKDDLELLHAAISDYVEHRVASFDEEIRMIHKSGETINVHTRGFISRDKNGKAIRMVGTNIDITTRKQFESKLQQLNNNLEARVHRRTNELEKLNKELLLALDNAESANIAKGHFLANMSHEIRTPMNGIIGLTELTLRTDLNKTQREYLEKLKSSAEILLHILNDILDFSKIEAGKLEIESSSFNLISTIENTVSIFNVKAIEKGIDLIVNISDDVPKHVIGDKFRLHQVLSNLTSNAIKFTEHGSVSLTVENDIKQNFIRFIIKDTGIGIPENIQSELFKSFSQADNTTSRRYGGTGLGLAISKHLIKIMHGDIVLSSKENEGTIIDFTIKLPKSYDTSADTVNRTKKTSDKIHESQILQGLNVLVAEDVKVNQLIAKEFFTQAGMKVSIANNGKEAVEMAMDNSYDLVIMDIQMPEIDGYEATRLIRRINSYSNTPIIAMTANAMNDDEKRSFDAGMNGHISKPLDITTVITEIEEIYQN